MNRRVNKKAVVIITAILIFSLSLGAVVFADDNFQTLNAWFGSLSIYRNNQQVQLDVKPFIVDGTTYVPLRAVSELFDKDVGWDGINYRIDLNDKPDENLAHMTQELVEAQIKVLELESKVAQLETELAAKEEASKVDDIKDLESYLNRQHGTYKRVRFDIDLYKNRDDIDVDIYVDLDYDYYEWNDLSTSNIKSYLQDLVDDILKDYKNANIEGAIKDSSTSRRSTLVSFYTRTNGTVVIDTDYRDSGGRHSDLYDLEDDLNWYYDKHDGVYFHIALSGDRDSIRVDLFVYEEDWDWLGRNEQQYYLEKLYDAINDSFPYAEVYGDVYDDSYTSNYWLNRFEFDSRGSVYLDW